MLIKLNDNSDHIVTRLILCSQYKARAIKMKTHKKKIVSRDRHVEPSCKCSGRGCFCCREQPSSHPHRNVQLFPIVVWIASDPVKMSPEHFFPSRFQKSFLKKKKKTKTKKASPPSASDLHSPPTQRGGNTCFCFMSKHLPNSSADTLYYRQYRRDGSFGGGGCGSGGDETRKESCIEK